MNVRHVLAHEADRMKALRLRALREDPHGFSSTYEGESRLPDASVTRLAPRRGLRGLRGFRTPSCDDRA